MPSECRDCEDEGYVWNTFIPCNKCKKGRLIQHEENKKLLKYYTKRIKDLKREIKEFSGEINVT